MKNTDSQRKYRRTKILNFISKNAIYGIFGIVLIAALTVALTSIPSSGDPSATISPTAIVDVDPRTLTPTLIPSVSATPISEKTPSPSIPPLTPTPSTPVDDPDDNSDVDVGKDTKTTFTITLPFGKKSVITEFSTTTPIYSETLDEWSCHVGVDLACNAKDEVKSAANGIVKSISNDSLYGYTVVISHSDGYQTLYCGLETVSIKLDELVAAEQTIGTALGSIPYEAHMKDHIHFELSKDSVAVNPLSFIK